MWHAYLSARAWFSLEDTSAQLESAQYLVSSCNARPLVHPNPVTVVYSPPPPGIPEVDVTLYCKGGQRLRERNLLEIETDRESKRE